MSSMLTDDQGFILDAPLVTRLRAEMDDVTRDFQSLIDWCKTVDFPGDSVPPAEREFLVRLIKNLVAEMLGGFSDGLAKWVEFGDKILDGARAHTTADGHNEHTYADTRYEKTNLPFTVDQV